MYPIDLPARLVLLPGLGANHELFTPQKRVFGDALETPDFIPPTSANESIGSYAQRWAPMLKSQAGDDRPVIVGGISLGGMVAVEMAEALGAMGVVLVSSARRDAGVSLRSRVADLLGKPIPAAAGPKLLSAMSLPFALLDGLDDDEYTLVKRMAAAADPRVLKWGCGAIADWEFAGPIRVPIHQIHGSKDCILPPNGDADVEIRGGGHLINLTHPQTVNRFIGDAVQKITGLVATAVL